MAWGGAGWPWAHWESARNCRVWAAAVSGRRTRRARAEAPATDAGPASLVEGTVQGEKGSCGPGDVTVTKLLSKVWGCSWRSLSAGASCASQHSEPRPRS